MTSCLKLFFFFQLEKLCNTDKSLQEIKVDMERPFLNEHVQYVFKAQIKIKKMMKSQ